MTIICGNFSLVRFSFNFMRYEEDEYWHFTWRLLDNFSGKRLDITTKDRQSEHKGIHNRGIFAMFYLFAIKSIDRLV